MRKFCNPKLNQIKVVVLETCESTAKQIEFFILIELTIRYFIPVQNAFLVRLSPWLSSISHFSGQPRLTTRFLVRNCFKHWFGRNGKWKLRHRERYDRVSILGKTGCPYPLTCELIKTLTFVKKYHPCFSESRQVWQNTNGIIEFLR